MPTIKEIKTLAFYIELLEEHICEVTPEEKLGYILAIECLKEQKLWLEDMITEAYSDSFYEKYSSFLEC